MHSCQDGHWQIFYDGDNPDCPLCERIQSYILGTTPGEGLAWQKEQCEALAWALLPPREWDRYDHQRAAVHKLVLERMQKALAQAGQKRGKG